MQGVLDGLALDVEHAGLQEHVDGGFHLQFLPRRARRHDIPDPDS
jgi:hypothetical protein